jgi:hypothetical protein
MSWSVSSIGKRLRSEGLKELTNVVCSYSDWRTYSRIIAEDERRWSLELHWCAGVERGVSDGRNRILARTLVRDDENTEQGLEDMREIGITYLQAQVISNAVQCKCSAHISASQSSSVTVNLDMQRLVRLRVLKDLSRKLPRDDASFILTEIPGPSLWVRSQDAPPVLLRACSMVRSSKVG